MLEFLPRDVYTDILTRLPIKCLVQCTAVCKSWCSLVTNPIFITTHLNRLAVMNNDNKLLLVQNRSGDHNGEHYSLHYDNQMLDQYAKLRFPLKSRANYYFRIIGSCNGVICLSDDKFTVTSDLYLWNPSIQKLIALPRVRITFQSHGPFTHNIGFGFDPLTDDYKVVRIVHLNDVEIPPEVDVFTLSTGTWRNISHLGLPYIIENRTPQAYVKGAAHWIASDSRGDLHCRLIVLFHMGDEVFHEIMLPGSIADIGYYLPSLRVAKFRESLSLMEFQLNSGWDAADDYFCVWVMKEYGVVTSWSKQFNIDVSNFSPSVVGFRKKSDVLRETIQGFLVSLDIEAHRLEKLKICNCGGPCLFYADAYMESLVLLWTKPAFCMEKTVKLVRKPRMGDKKQRREGIASSTRVFFFFKGCNVAGVENEKEEKRRKVNH